MDKDHIIKLPEPTYRSPMLVALRKRHPRPQKFRGKTERRSKDARQHWSREEE